MELMVLLIKLRNMIKSCGKTTAEYYASVLPNVINKAVANIRQYWLLAEMVNGNESWETVLKDKVLANLRGINTYDELTKSDIDSLIVAFQEIQEKLDD